MIFPDLVEVYEAFVLLGAGRGYNEAGPQPIPHSEIITYMNDRGVVNPDERLEFEQLLRTADSKYLDLVHEKIARERERLSKKQNSSSKGRAR